MILRLTKLLVLSLPLILSSSSALATTILNYEGYPFNQGSTDLLGERLTATVAFSAPLTDGAVLTLADISSFTISAAGRTITSETATFAIAEFTFGPDGLPNDWGLVAELDIESGTAPETLATHGGTTSEVFGQIQSLFTDIFFIDDTIPNDALATASGGLGRVNSVIRSNWSLAAVPEPSTAFSCGLALALLTCLRRPRV